MSTLLKRFQVLNNRRVRPWRIEPNQPTWKRNFAHLLLSFNFSRQLEQRIMRSVAAIIYVLFHFTLAKEEDAHGRRRMPRTSEGETAPLIQHLISPWAFSIEIISRNTPTRFWSAFDRKTKAIKILARRLSWCWITIIITWRKIKFSSSFSPSSSQQAPRRLIDELISHTREACKILINPLDIQSRTREIIFFAQKCLYRWTSSSWELKLAVDGKSSLGNFFSTLMTLSDQRDRTLILLIYIPNAALGTIALSRSHHHPCLLHFGCFYKPFFYWRFFYIQFHFRFHD